MVVLLHEPRVQPLLVREVSITFYPSLSLLLLSTVILSGVGNTSSCGVEAGGDGNLGSRPQDQVLSSSSWFGKYKETLQRETRTQSPQEMLVNGMKHVPQSFPTQVGGRGCAVCSPAVFRL